jgi:hypothetical protein
MQIIPFSGPDFSFVLAQGIPEFVLPPALRVVKLKRVPVSFWSSSTAWRVEVLTTSNDENEYPWLLSASMALESFYQSGTPILTIQ